MKFRDYINEAKATSQVKKEIENFLRLEPDYILYNTTRMDPKIYGKTDFLINLLQYPQDTISIGKYTLEGIVSIQLYVDRGKVKIDRSK